MKKIINIGKNTANLRKEKNKTAEQLAEALEVSRQTISKWEKGYTVPDAYTMAKMATFFDVPIADIYVQTLVGERKKNEEEMDLQELLIHYVDPRSIEKAIVAYDRNPNKLKVKVGTNVISYRDILLLAANMRFFRGYSELENPVSYHEMKDERGVMPDFVQLLKNEGFIVFYASGEFACDESVIGSEYTTVNEGSFMLVVLRNEKEILSFKTSARRFFTGLDDEKCEREWDNPSGMKYMLGARYYDADIYKAEEYLSSEKNSLSEKERKEYRKKLDEMWEDEIENCSIIQYIKDDQELSKIKRQLESLDKNTLDEFIHACFADKLESIVVVDLGARRFTPLFEEQKQSV